MTYDVVMAVMNPAAGDSRVLKSAQALHEAGLKTVLLGTDPIAVPRGTWASIPLREYPTLITGGPTTRDTTGLSRAELFAARVRAFEEDVVEFCRKYRPRFVHTHDFSTPGIGRALKTDEELKGITWIHDIHEWIEGLAFVETEIREFAQQEEAKSIELADYVLTVSPDLVEMKAAQFKLKREPVLLLNVPEASRASEATVDLRSALNLDKDVVLAVYSGAVRPPRGLHYFVPVLSAIPNLHLALVTNDQGEYIESLKQLAADCGAADRLHFHPYVEQHELPLFLSTASFGINPLEAYGNVEIALPTKFFEYIQAGLPILSAPLRRAKLFLAETKIGVAYDSVDVADIAASVATIIENRAQYLPGPEIQRRYRWEREKANLLKCYAAELGFGGVATEAGLLGELFGPPLKSKSRSLHISPKNDRAPRVIAEGLRASKKASARTVALTVDTQQPGADVLAPLLGAVEEERYRFAAELGRHCDVAHFYGASLFGAWTDPRWPNFSDVIAMRQAGTKVVYHVDDVISPPKRGVGEEGDTAASPLDAVREAQALQVVALAADRVVVSSPRHKRLLPDALFIPWLIDVPEVDQQPQPDGNELEIVWIADREDAISAGPAGVLEEELRAAGITARIEVIAARGDLDFDVFRRAALIVDFGEPGWYSKRGTLGLALGKPVLAEIDELNVEAVGSRPAVIPVEPGTLAAAVERLARNPKGLAEAGERGRRFHERFHGAARIAAINALHQELRRRQGGADTGPDLSKLFALLTAGAGARAGGRERSGQAVALLTSAIARQAQRSHAFVARNQTLLSRINAMKAELKDQQRALRATSRYCGLAMPQAAEAIAQFSRVARSLPGSEAMTPLGIALKRTARLLDRVAESCEPPSGETLPKLDAEGSEKRSRKVAPKPRATAVLSRTLDAIEADLRKLDLDGGQPVSLVMKEFDRPGQHGRTLSLFRLLSDPEPESFDAVLVGDSVKRLHPLVATAVARAAEMHLCRSKTAMFRPSAEPEDALALWLLEQLGDDASSGPGVNKRVSRLSHYFQTGGVRADQLRRVLPVLLGGEAQLQSVYHDSGIGLVPCLLALDPSVRELQTTVTQSTDWHTSFGITLAAALGLGNLVQFEKSSPLDFEYDDGIDLVCFHHALQGLEPGRRGEAIERAWNALRPGGAIVFKETLAVENPGQGVDLAELVGSRGKLSVFHRGSRYCEPLPIDQAGDAELRSGPLLVLSK